MSRHFLQLGDFTREELHHLIQRSIELKRFQRDGIPHESCKRKTMAMIFELSSTRTRVAFETGMAQLGGHALFLNPRDTQLGRGEPIKDTARVLAQMVDIVMIRAKRHATIEEYARHSDVPVINGMSDELHPCQLLADIMTVTERRGGMQDCRVAFVGDGYNMCQSFIEASQMIDFDLAIATPPGYRPKEKYLDLSKRVRMAKSPEEAVNNADVVVTDVWSSMGHENNADRIAAFEGFQLNAHLLDRAKADVVFLHCLPAHRGEEVDDNVIDDPRSAVWDETGNRLHTQKALIEFLLQ